MIKRTKYIWKCKLCMKVGDSIRIESTNENNTMELANLHLKRIHSITKIGLEGGE